MPQSRGVVTVEATETMDACAERVRIDPGSAQSEASCAVLMPALVAASAAFVHV
jgi:hypothetical protein